MQEVGQRMEQLPRASVGLKPGNGLSWAADGLWFQSGHMNSAGVGGGSWCKHGMCGGLMSVDLRE